MTREDIQVFLKTETIKTYFQRHTQSKYFEDQYLYSLKDVIENGVGSDDRTGTGTIRLESGYRFVMSEHNIPLLRGKFVNPYGALTEVIWILTGRTDLQYLKDNGVNYWDSWAKEDGTFGPIYGHQMRQQNGFDQLIHTINKLNESPETRQAYITLWNGSDLKDMALPPCFTEGKHYVSMKNGNYELIENINIGDFVLTDDGSYQKVTNVMKTPFKGKIKKIKHNLSGNKIESTLNHPFLIKEKNTKLNETNLIYVDSENIKVDDYLSITSPTFDSKKSAHIIEYESNLSHNKKVDKTHAFNSEEEFYFMGYYLGNGWTENKIKDKKCKHKYYISISDKKQTEILSKINKCASLGIINNSGDNVKKFQGANIKWWTILQEFGRGAQNKKIPDFIFQMEEKFIEKFIEGYFDADGCETKTYKYSATTVSPSLSLGIQKLFTLLNKQVLSTKTYKEEKTIILGREVNQNHVYSINVPHQNREDKTIYNLNNKIKHTIIEDYELEDYDGFVYNLSVENNPTYTVNNIITHNCHLAYHPLIVNSKLHLHCGQRSADSFLGVPYDYMLFYFIQQILCYFTNTTPGNIVHTNNDYHIYQNHYSAVAKYMSNYINNPYHIDMKSKIEFDLHFPEKPARLTSESLTDWLYEFHSCNREFKHNYERNVTTHHLIKAEVSV